MKTSESGTEKEAKIQNDHLQNEHNLLSNKYEELEKKYNNLVEKLKARLECPVCLDVPESGPVYPCSNGHLICSTCNRDFCPTCRAKMTGGKSILAVTALENIDHQCKNNGCEMKSHLEELETHRKECSFRVVLCPAIKCDEQMPFFSVIDHIVNGCDHSFANQDEVISELVTSEHRQTFNFKYDNDGSSFFNVDTMIWKDRHFFLNMAHTAAVGWTFHVEMLGSRETCSNYEVEISVHRIDDEEGRGRYVHMFRGEPCALEEAKETKRLSGLLVSKNNMDSKILKADLEDKFTFRISISFCRYNTSKY